MKIATILIAFLVQCTHLRAAPHPGFMDEFMDEFMDGSCLLGVTSIEVVLHNRNYPEGKIIKEDETCDYIDSSKPVCFVVHGFLSSANATNFKNLASELVQKDICTVFAVDWSQGACTDGTYAIKPFQYPKAVTNTREIGQHIAKYIIALAKYCHVSMKDIKLFGHSLGAHVCGFAAKNVEETIDFKLPLIVALDPADPAFGGNKPKDRLCKSDVKRLVVFKTSPLGINNLESDLYLQFDAGTMQPGCNVNVACSHSKSVEYCTNIVKGDCQFLGVPLPKKNGFFSMFDGAPEYPTSDTKDCIVVNRNILQTNNPIKGEYYVFPQCATETFHCKQ